MTQSVTEHVALLAEIRRVLKPQGLLFVFEHNPLNPLTRHAVDTCPFDENAVLIRAPKMRRRVLDAAFAEARINYRIFCACMSPAKHKPPHIRRSCG